MRGWSWSTPPAEAELRPLVDARTTPPVLRLPVLVGLVLFALYLVLCARFAWSVLTGAPEPVPFAGHDDWFRMGRWHMFTELRPAHTRLRAEAWTGSWQEVDVDALFPDEGAAGPLVQQTHFWQRDHHLRELGQALCRRVAPPPSAVRLWMQRWDKTPGQVEQPVVGEQWTELLSWSCTGGP